MCTDQFMLGLHDIDTLVTLVIGLAYGFVKSGKLAQFAELLVNIQYACQRHYFGAMAEKYFDDQRRDISANARRKQKTIEAFNCLPDEFTAEDIMRCFRLEGESSARGRARTLLADHVAVKTGKFKENGKVKNLYRKTGTVML